ncbi:uncharacterized protein LOC110191192 isoform X2 [Drosophila serrata]|uniref:uncharacterized protein LOC110191192 isoform X2 n=1 Tax=Drosophila serrata TaxID=7274 RepID=UPI000A1D37F5|nr:uncharacterized protein LOC110191192 isoform X2 [Drosophila serrata]
MLASVSVRDLVKLYENLIANASNDAQGKPLRMLEQKAAKLRSLSDVSMHNLDLDQSASGEPHRVVLKVIDLPIMDYEVPDMLEESANKTFQPEPQSVEKPQRLDQKSSGCMKLVFRRITHLLRLQNQPLNYPAPKSSKKHF